MPRTPPPPRDRTFTVQQAKDLLPWIVQHVGGVPHGKAVQLLKEGGVKVNGVLVRDQKHRLAARDTVVILAQGAGEARSVPFPILLEDEHLVVIDKPSGLLSVGTDNERERTAHRMLGERAGGRVFVVHRLDRETSGVLIFAKTPGAKDALQGAWEQVEKEYFAVVEGIPAQKEATLVDFLREDEAGLRVHVVDNERAGKRAVTHYRVLSSRNGRALLSVRLETGRKHQIRVQLAEAGFPICGDDRYGKGKPAPRLALHAHRIRFPHPATGQQVVVESPLPGVLAKLAGKP